MASLAEPRLCGGSAEPECGWEEYRESVTVVETYRYPGVAASVKTCFGGIPYGLAAWRRLALVCALSVLIISVLGGCATNSQADRSVESPVYQKEFFDRETPYWKAFSARPAEICESARQALMSQGYLITESQQISSPPVGALIINGRKFIEPKHGAEIELAVNVTCASRGETSGIAYVTAWEDHLVTKRNALPASVGLGPVGSISLPLSSAEDSLVKVGVSMISDQTFYARFYGLIDSLLPH